MEPVRSDLVQDSDLWFADGSIVLQAENTLFKVYAGILSQASSVFKAMITIPQGGAQLSENYEECPLVSMAGDSAQDMHAFLKALHDSSNFELKDAKPSDIPLISSVLRLSTKYEVPHLRRRCVEALRNWYPTTMSEYVTMCKSGLPRASFWRHIMVANIARETDALILLPAALLFCCSTARPQHLWDGVDKDDMHYELVPANKRAIFIGRPLLGHAARIRSQPFFFSLHKADTTEAVLTKCTSPTRCTEFCKAYSAVFNEKEDPWINPFFQLNWNFIRNTCCMRCATIWQTHNMEANEKLWEELPSIFGLPSWDLLRVQEQSIGPLES